MKLLTEVFRFPWWWWFVDLQHYALQQKQTGGSQFSCLACAKKDFRCKSPAADVFTIQVGLQMSFSCMWPLSHANHCATPDWNHWISRSLSVKHPCKCPSSIHITFPNPVLSPSPPCYFVLKRKEVRGRKLSPLSWAQTAGSGNVLAEPYPLTKPQTASPWLSFRLGFFLN